MQVQNQSVYLPLDSEAVHLMRRRLLNHNEKAQKAPAESDSGPSGDIFELSAGATHDDKSRIVNNDAQLSYSSTPFDALDTTGAADLLHMRRRMVHDDAVKAASQNPEPSMATESGRAVENVDGETAKRDRAAVHSTAQKLEGVFLTSLITRMREAAGVEFFGGTPGAQVFEGMFDQMMGDSLSESRGVGLYKEIERSIHDQSSRPELETTGAVQSRLAGIGSIEA